MLIAIVPLLGCAQACVVLWALHPVVILDPSYLLSPVLLSAVPRPLLSATYEETRVCAILLVVRLPSASGTLVATKWPVPRVVAVSDVLLEAIAGRER